MATATKTNNRPAPTQQQSESDFDGAQWLKGELEKTWLDTQLLAEVSTIDTVGKKFEQEVAGVGSKMAQAMVFAHGQQVLRKVVSEKMVDALMTLQNQEWGFLTDERDRGYPKDVVKRCAIDAWLMGLQPFGNEWNIIKGKCFPVLNGWRRKVHQIPGLSEDRIVLGPPREWGKLGLRVECSATWKIDGRQFRLDKECSLKLDGGTTGDNADGKLHRKMYRAIYLRVNGHAYLLADQDEVEGATATAETAAEGTAKAAKETPASERDKADVRVADAYQAALAAKTINKEKYRVLLKDEFDVKERRLLSTAQLVRLAEKLEALAAPVESLKEGRAQLSRNLNACHAAGVWDNEIYKGWLAELKITDTNQLDLAGLTTLCDLVAAKHNSGVVNPQTLPEALAEEHPGDPEPERGDAWEDPGAKPLAHQERR